MISRARSDRRVEAVAVADDEVHAGALRGRDHRARLVERERHRLFDEHVLAARRGGDRVLGVVLVRRGDVDGFDRRVGAQRLDVRRRRARRSRAAKRSRASRADRRRRRAPRAGARASVGSISVKARPSPATPRRRVRGAPFSRVDRSTISGVQRPRDADHDLSVSRSSSVSTRSRWSASPASEPRAAGAAGAALAGAGRLVPARAHRLEDRDARAARRCARPDFASTHGEGLVVGFRLRRRRRGSSRSGSRRAASGPSCRAPPPAAARGPQQ